MSPNVLADRDINAAAATKQPEDKPQGQEKTDVKSMEYHRQVLQSKLEEDQYVFSLRPYLQIYSFERSVFADGHLHPEESKLTSPPPITS